MSYITAILLLHVSVSPVFHFAQSRELSDVTICELDPLGQFSQPPGPRLIEKRIYRAAV
jgi:hypothetical protein